MSQYFYSYLEPISKELARTLKELEGVIYNSPRTMLTHSRTLIEVVMGKVLVHEKIACEPYLTIIERTNRLDEHELLTAEVREALHEVRKLGNVAAHDVRRFRYSESLITWERIYEIMKWFVEVYGPYDVEVPEYVDPVMKIESSYDLEEMQVRLKRIEKALKQSINQEQTTVTEQEETGKEIVLDNSNEEQVKLDLDDAINERPGLTTIRTITCQDESLEIPYFLRDAFLLPQRFEKSEQFLIRLGGVQEARIMSELPASLDNLYEKVIRYNESHTANFFIELKQFVKEEVRRRELSKARRGELFLFYNEEEIIVTEELGEEAISEQSFTGMPSLIKQLHADGIFCVKDLPKELVIIGKYKSVGKTRIKQFFEQLREIQGK